MADEIQVDQIIGRLENQADTDESRHAEQVARDRALGQILLHGVSPNVPDVRPWRRRRNGSVVGIFSHLIRCRDLDGGRDRLARRLGDKLGGAGLYGLFQTGHELGLGQAGNEGGQVASRSR